MDLWEDIPDTATRRPTALLTRHAFDQGGFNPEQHPRGGNPANTGQFSAEAKGDVYGKPMPAGRYEEGDPRNDPEYEKVEKQKNGLIQRYVGVTRDRIEKAQEKGASEQELARLWAARRATKKDREQGIGGETQELFDRLPDPKTGAHKVYLPERRALHHKILDDLEARADKVPHDGKLVILAGPSGAGKSTFLDKHGDKLGVQFTTNEQGKRVPKNFITLNPDDLKDLLPVDLNRYPGIHKNETASITHEESSDLCKQAVQRLMSKGVNVILDVTLANASKAEKQYIDPYPGYQVTTALVDGDMKNSFHNAGLRYKEIDKKTGQRTYNGRFVPMGIVAGQRPTKPGYRSVNAEQFEQFLQHPQVAKGRAFVYDPYNKEAGPVEISPGSSVRHESRMVVEGFMQQRTHITEKIRDFHRGKVDRAGLVHYLTEETRYAQPKHEFAHGDHPGRWHEVDGGTPYTPGSFDEVDLAHNTGLLPRDIYNEVADKLSRRAHGLQ